MVRHLIFEKLQHSFAVEKTFQDFEESFYTTKPLLDDNFFLKLCKIEKKLVEKLSFGISDCCSFLFRTVS